MEIEMLFTVRHRKLLKDWSMAILLCEDWPAAQSAAAHIVNSVVEIAEVQIYDPLAVRTATIYPAYVDGVKQPMAPSEVR